MSIRQPIPSAPFALRPPSRPVDRPSQDRTGYRGAAQESFGVEALPSPVRVTVEADTWGAGGLVLGVLFWLSRR